MKENLNTILTTIDNNAQANFTIKLFYTYFCTIKEALWH